MKRLRTALIVIFIMSILAPLNLFAVSAIQAQSKVVQVVYITLTKACACTLERCQTADVVVGNVFKGARQSLLKRLDYSTEKDAARVYLKKYRVTQAPALLFLGAQGNLLWMAMGELSEIDLMEKLGQFGG